MRVAIVGYALEGRSALKYWQDQGAEVTICDQDPKKSIPAGVERQLGPDYLKDLDQFDVVMRTAGMNPKVILDANPGIEAKITTTVNEFMRVSPTKNIIGVTGTKGKGTTSALTTLMLEAAGKKAFLGGNYGISPFDFLPRLTKDSWVVLELSSYMLYDIKHSPHIGICLMVQPEHLDWHGGKEGYFLAKQNLFAHQTKDDIAIYYAKNPVSHRLASVSPGTQIPYYGIPGAYISDGKVMIDETVLCHISELKLLGRHNWQNVAAATTAVWQAVQNPKAIHKVLSTFTGLPHRLERVGVKDDVTYYNDSFASDPYATEAAIEAVPGTKVLIVGGYDRMLELDGFTKAVKEDESKIRNILLIGQSAERVAKALQKGGYKAFRVSTAKDMQQVVTEARTLAKSGDSIVLSPGFPSFDMFKDFEVRGLAFKETVHNL